MDRFGPLMALGAMALCGCGQEVTFSSQRPELAVLPEALDFGEIVANEELGVQLIFIQNNGLADLEYEIGFEGEGLDRFSAETQAGLLEPDTAIEVPITFEPTALEGVTAELVVTSNDPEQRFWVVPLTGVGRVPYAPDIEIRPVSVVDFGVVNVGDDDTNFFEIFNAGDADLLIGSVGQEGAGTFSLASDPSGATVPPLQSRAVLVNFTPVQGNGDSGTLSIPSNDADEPVVTVEFLGNGGGVFDYPEAIIDCPGVVDIAGPIVVHLDGSASTDPGARPLTYDWELVRRPLSADPNRQPDPTDTSETDLLIDAAGTWEVTLTVENDLDPPIPSVPAKCVIEAIPIDEIHVEVSWAGATADFDLHLAEGDADFYVSPGDANWCNPNPDWGVTGQTLDDPSLDVDDSDGYGPENINITVPADGTYAVRVHHYDDGDDGTVTGNVQIFTYGALAWEGSAVLARNEVWEVGQINWPDGTFGASTSPAWDAGGTRECR